MRLHPKQALSVLAATAVFVTACADDATGPDSETPDPSSTETVSLSFDDEIQRADADDNGSDDLILADEQEVSLRDISGSAMSGNLRIAVEDTFTLSVTDIAQIDPVIGTECPDEQLAVLRDAGVLDTPLTGDLVLELDQRAATLLIRLTDVDLDGEKWFVTVFRTVNQPGPEIQPLGERVSVRLWNAKIVFPVEDPEGPTDTDIGCRVNLHFEIDGLD